MRADEASEAFAQGRRILHTEFGQGVMLNVSVTRRRAIISAANRALRAGVRYRKSRMKRLFSHAVLVTLRVFRERVLHLLHCLDFNLANPLSRDIEFCGQIMQRELISFGLEPACLNDAAAALVE